MTLEEAVDLVINEAETSALGDGNEEVMDAVKLLKCFHDEHGYQFKNYECFREKLIVDINQL